VIWRARSIRGGSAIAAIERCLAILVAFSVQIVAVAVIGDVFASAPAADAALPTSSDGVIARVARVAPLARGERLMAEDLAIDLVPEITSGPTFDVALGSNASVGPQANAEPAPAASADAAPDATPEPGPPLIAEPPPQPKIDPTPAPRQLPAPPAIATSSATQDAELRMLALMNASRLQQGLVPLAFDARASDAARRHSGVEAEHRYVYHDGADGTAASRNVPACGTGWYGENTGKVWSGGVDVLHREFMAEPWAPINHRTNIMDPNFRRAGVGAVQGPDAVYVTVVFCR
jgi:uncharacterized protein YkwD